MKYITHALIELSLIAMLGIGAMAQSTKPVHRSDKTFVQPKQVSNVKQIPKQDLGTAVEKAAKYQQRLQTKAYLGRANVRKMCEKVEGCATWARSEFEKNHDFTLTLVQVRHDRTIKKGNNYIVTEQEVIFSYSLGNENLQVKSFVSTNIPLFSPKCLDCSHIIKAVYERTA